MFAKLANHWLQKVSIKSVSMRTQILGMVLFTVLFTVITLTIMTIYQTFNHLTDNLEQRGTSTSAMIAEAIGPSINYQDRMFVRNVVEAVLVPSLAVTFKFSVPISKKLGVPSKSILSLALEIIYKAELSVTKAQSPTTIIFCAYSKSHVPTILGLDLLLTSMICIP